MQANDTFCQQTDRQTHRPIVSAHKANTRPSCLRYWPPSILFIYPQWIARRLHGDSVTGLLGREKLWINGSPYTVRLISRKVDDKYNICTLRGLSCATRRSHFAYKNHSLPRVIQNSKFLHLFCSQWCFYKLRLHINAVEFRSQIPCLLVFGCTCKRSLCRPFNKCIGPMVEMIRPRHSYRLQHLRRKVSVQICEANILNLTVWQACIGVYCMWLFLFALCSL